MDLIYRYLQQSAVQFPDDADDAENADDEDNAVSYRENGERKRKNDKKSGPANHAWSGYQK